MKKRMIVALLVICLLVSFCVPTVLATEAGSGTSEIPSMEYRFGDYGNNGEYLADCTNNIMISYGAQTMDWRYEAASTTYQFRVKGKHTDATSTGKNMFIADALQFFGAKDWWYALRLRAPETGKFALTLTKGGEAQTEVYFLDAAAIEDALGDNAIAYAFAMNEDPYLAASTQAFTEYKNIINSMLEGATPVMTAVPAEVKEMTGECSFKGDNEYVMVVKFVGEGSVRTQLSTLTGIWIGEAEGLPGEDDTQFDIKMILIPVAVVLVAGGVVIAVVATRKKKEE